LASDATLKRDELARIVFSSETNRKKVEAILQSSHR
jgi:dephospho-CoA kinase